LETRFGFLSTDEWILGIWTSDEKKSHAKPQRRKEKTNRRQETSLSMSSWIRKLGVDKAK
jgi:hypothetical protein